jgi:hypothetical protein
LEARSPVIKGSSSVKRVGWDRTQVESVRIEDSSGQQSSEERDGLVGVASSRRKIYQLEVL